MTNERALADQVRTTEWEDRFLALRVGMSTAAEVVRQHHGQRYARCILDYEQQWWAKIEAKRAGCREMVAGDIFLPRPMMTAGDIGWPA